MTVNPKFFSIVFSLFMMISSESVFCQNQVFKNYNRESFRVEKTVCQNMDSSIRGWISSDSICINFTDRNAPDSVATFITISTTLSNSTFLLIDPYFGTKKIGSDVFPSVSYRIAEITPGRVTVGVLDLIFKTNEDIASGNVLFVKGITPSGLHFVSQPIQGK